MRRSLAISLVTILLLNILGHYGVFFKLQYQNEIAMTRAIDSETYDASQTVTIKIPVSVAYMSDQIDFERVTGDFEYKGELYRMVKQKYAKDTLTIVCVRDGEKKSIDLILTEYASTFADIANDSRPATKLTITFLKDYLPVSFSITKESPGWSATIPHNSSYGSLIPTFTASIVHPPERA